MKATKFIKKFQDLCNAHCEGGKCDGCPIGPDKRADVCGLLTMQPKTLVKLVKNWAKGKSTKEASCDEPTAPTMTLKEFVKNFVHPDAVIQLWRVDDEGGFFRLSGVSVDGKPGNLCLSGETCGTATALLSGEGWQTYYENDKVYCITNILSKEPVSAVNIVLHNKGNTNGRVD